MDTPAARRLQPWLGEGASKVMRALSTGGTGDLLDAHASQREDFRAQFGCYLEDAEVIPCGTEEEREAFRQRFGCYPEQMP